MSEDKKYYLISLFTGLLLVAILDCFTFYTEKIPVFVDSLSIYGINMDSYDVHLGLFIFINIFCVAFFAIKQKKLLTIRSGIVLLLTLSMLDVLSTLCFVNFSSPDDSFNWDKLIIQIKVISNIVLTPVLIFVLIVIPEVLKPDRSN